MAIIQPAVRKRDKKFSFEVQLKWLPATNSLLYTGEVQQAIKVTPPTAFGGDGMDWSPEHLLLGSICSCFVTTYLTLARKYEFEVAAVESNVIGQIEFIEGAFRFTTINIFPKIFVAHEELLDKAKLALEKTPQYCIVANSIKAEKVYHGEVLLQTAHANGRKPSLAN
jgi:peroxiredoxin-like protein